MRLRFPLLLAVSLAFPAPVRAAAHAAVEKKGDALAALLEGNARFAEGRATHPNQDAAARAKLASGQNPDAIVLSCSDSRVPPEIVFDQGLGQVFTVRTAGEVVASPEIASLEYAVEHFGVKLLVVLGHDSCGAVKAALDTPVGKSAGSPDLDRLVAAIRPGIENHRGDPADKTLREAVSANAVEVSRSLTRRSKILKDAMEKGGLRIVPAIYGLSTGRVELLEPR